MAEKDTWTRVEAIFDAALALPESERNAWVRETCATDPEVRDQVLALLGARENMGDFLQAPMIDFTGQTFGAYRAREEIGRGGMSVVYSGERADGGFEKRIAIKVILLQAQGALQDGETRILAALEHHNIARLIDAGVTPLGFRYLLMEFVEGKPCTVYAAGVPERERLRLFLQMCAGVQYAHRSLVVHRDLKPDNILVTADGAVKLLDFGIAKMLQPGADGAQTKGVQAYTPDYASPEQILGLPVTTATDVYSLGVLLCEMLSSKRPRSFTGLAVAEVVAKAQTEEVPSLPLQGDLAVIAGKALRRDPGERYDSASALARDIERYLAGMPIEAREPTWAYRARKFVSRNRIAVGAASLAVAGLALATGIAVWQARLASTRFEQVRSLARAVMFDLHDAVRPLSGSLVARKLIVDRSLEYLNTLAADTSASGEVQLDVARGFLRLADIQGKDNGGSSLGQSAAALESATQALRIAERVAAGRPADRAAQGVWIDALDYCTTAYTLRGEMAKAIPLGLKAVALAGELAAAAPNDLNTKERLATVTKQLASAYQDDGKLDQAIPLYRRALELRRELFTEDPTLRRQQRYAEAHQWLGTALGAVKDFRGLAENAREALRIDEDRYRKDPVNARANVAGDAVLLASAERRNGNLNEAIALLERALSMRREIAAEDPKSAIAALRVAAAADRLADTLRDAGRLREAIRLGEEAVRDARRLQKLDPANTMANRETVYSAADLAKAYQKAGNKARACVLAREVLAFANGPVKGIRPALNKSLEESKVIADSCR